MTINRILAPMFSLILYPVQHMPKSSQWNVQVFTFAIFKIKVFWHFIRCRMLWISFSWTDPFNEIESVCVRKRKFYIERKEKGEKGWTIKFHKRSSAGVCTYVNICKNSDLICCRHFNVQMENIECYVNRHQFAFVKFTVGLNCLLELRLNR